MSRVFLLALALLSLNAFAQTERVLSNGQLAYYGSEFYGKAFSREALFKILDGTHTVVDGAPDKIAQSCAGATCYKHTSVGYDGARKIMFGETYIEKDDKGTFVRDVYCGKKIYYTDPSDISNMSSQVNIEHTWPQSKFSSSFDKGMQKSDMHHLYPTDSNANNRRANFWFGELNNAPNELNVEGCSISGLSDVSGHMLFTPPAGHKGNVARSLFYFSFRYKMGMDQALRLILKTWNRLDPVDATERAHHEIVAKYEKVRNPFVDYPELVDKAADL